MALDFILYDSRKNDLDDFYHTLLFKNDDKLLSHYAVRLSDHTAVLIPYMVQFKPNTIIRYN